MCADKLKLTKSLQPLLYAAIFKKFSLEFDLMIIYVNVFVSLIILDASIASKSSLTWSIIIMHLWDKEEIILSIDLAIIIWKSFKSKDESNLFRKSILLEQTINFIMQL